MKRISSIALAALAMLAFAGCQEEEAAPVDAMAINGTEFTFTNQGGSTTINFVSNVAWTAEASQGWITLSQDAGEAGQSSVVVTVTKNASYADRTGTVKLTAGDIVSTFSVKQLKNEDAIDVLTIRGADINFTNAGGTQTITIQTNAAWTASANQSWITLKQTSGEAGEAKIEVTAAANEDFADREGKVTVKVGKATTEFYVKQSEQKVFATISGVLVSAEAQIVPLLAYTNLNYTVVVDEDAQDWIQVEKFDPTKAEPVLDYLLIALDENTGYTSRTGTIELVDENGCCGMAYSITQESNYTETYLAGVSYLGMAMKIYDDEEGAYLEDYDEYAIALCSEDGKSEILLALNAEAGQDKTVFPTGEFTCATDFSHTAGTFAIATEDEPIYSCINIEEREFQIADGVVTVTKDEEGNYTIVADVLDEYEIMRQYSFVGTIEDINDNSFAAVNQGAISYRGQYGTYFATKAKEFDYYFTISRAPEGCDFALNYVCLSLYAPEDADPEVVPVGTYTLAAGNEITEIENPVYKCGNYNAQPWTFTWSGNDKADYAERTYTNIKDGATISIYEDEGQYFIAIDAELQTYQYDKDNSPVTTSDWFKYEAIIPVTTTPEVKDVSVQIIEDVDWEFTGTVNVNPAYIGFWFGDSYGIGGNVFYFGWSSGVDGNFAVNFTINSSSAWTFEKNYGSNCSTPVPTGVYTFVDEKPTTNGNYICNVKKASYKKITNSYTGSYVLINKGTIEIGTKEIKVDIEGPLYVNGSSTPSEKTIHYTGKLPATCFYLRNFSAANRQTNVEWESAN